VNDRSARPALGADVAIAAVRINDALLNVWFTLLSSLVPFDGPSPLRGAVGHLHGLDGLECASSFFRRDPARIVSTPRLAQYAVEMTLCQDDEATSSRAYCGFPVELSRPAWSRPDQQDAFAQTEARPMLAFRR
jgi:hypothetical protein